MKTKIKEFDTIKTIRSKQDDSIFSNFAKKIVTMKKSHIIGIVMILAAIVILTLVAGDMSTYATFKEAALQPDISVKLSGELVKNKEIVYRPEVDANHFSFYVKDSEGTVKKVILRAAKPQDFERSETIILTGKMRGDEFIASDMLMKCPSKYKDEEVFVKARS